MILHIDPEWRDLLPPLTTPEREALTESLVQDGQKADILIWHEATTGKDWIVDGHNRYEILSSLGMPAMVAAAPIPTDATRADVRAWIIAYQGARRNLTRDQRIALHVTHTAQRAYPAEWPAHVIEWVREGIAAGYGSDLISNRLTVRQVRHRMHPPARGARDTTPAAPPAGSDLPDPSPRSAAELAAQRRIEVAAKVAASERKSLVEKVAELEDALAFRSEARSDARVDCDLGRLISIGASRSRPKSGMRIATPCFVISDLHFGETVTLAESLGANQYDLEIAAARMRICWDNMLWLRADMARTQTCDDTWCALNGDIVSGDIHAELSETNAGGMRAQCAAAREALAPGVIELADATPGQLHMVCIGGNHGRLTHRQQIKNGTQHSAEHLGVYDPLAAVIGAGPKGNIVWHIPSAERYITEVNGHRISTQHGTMIRSQGGIGGTLVPMTRWVTRAADADYYVFGHFHEADAYGKVIKNGALIGESGYTKWLGVEPRPPEQVAFAMDQVRGMRRFERVSVT